MTEQQIDRDRLRELANAATPGPWLPHARYVWTSELGGIIQNWSEDANAAADMELIAAARTAVPALLDMLDQAEAERDWNLSSSRLAKEERIKANARADQAEFERDHARAQVDRVRELLTKWVDEYGDPVYRGNGWAEGVRDAAREALKAMDGER